MKKFAMILLFSLLTLISIFPEATVLPSGTAITIPDKGSIFLSESHFLLDRASMEEATLALEALPIREKQIADLTASWNKIDGELKTWQLWGTVGLIAGPILAFVLDELVHLALGR